jgi:hypothetical protein
MRKKIKIFLSATIYLLIGLFFYWTGYIDAPFPENIFTFFYVVFLWPIVVGLWIILN